MFFCALEFRTRLYILYLLTNKTINDMKTNNNINIENIAPYYVIAWDINHDVVERYNVMTYLVHAYMNDIDNVRFETFDDVKRWIDKESRYQFWARCEYEIVVNGWPVSRREEKIDVYYQIAMNIDVITRHFINQMNIYVRDAK